MGAIAAHSHDLQVNNVSIPLFHSNFEAPSGKLPPIIHYNFICLIMVLPKEDSEYSPLKTKLYLWKKSQ